MIFEIGFVDYIVLTESVTVENGYIEILIKFKDHEAALRRYNTILASLKGKQEIRFCVDEAWFVVKPTGYILDWKSESTLYCAIKIKMPR